MRIVLEYLGFQDSYKSLVLLYYLAITNKDDCNFCHKYIGTQSIFFITMSLKQIDFYY